MIHSLLQKGTGIDSDWLSFYLISLGFLFHGIRLLWSSKKIQLPLLGLCQEHFQHRVTKTSWLWGSLYYCDTQHRLNARHSASIFLCPYLIHLQMENIKKDIEPLAFCVFLLFNLTKTLKVLKVTTHQIQYNCIRLKYHEYFMYLNLQPLHCGVEWRFKGLM